MPVLEEINWSSGRRQRFERWFHKQLENTIGDRHELERNWEDYLEQWRAKFPEGSKSFPWPGASNLEMPLTSLHADPIYADFVTTLHTPEDYWHIEERRGNEVEQANSLREGMTALEEDFIDMRSVNERALLDHIVLGTSIYKSHWEDKREKTREYDFQTGEIEEQVKTKSRPVVDHVPLWDFFIPANARSINPDDQDGAQWVAERFTLTEAELMAKAEEDGQIQPAYDKAATDYVSNFIHETRFPEEEDLERKVEQEDDYTPFEDREIELYEVWARFDVDNDGLDEDVVVVWHQPTSTILRALHNPFAHGERPYVASRYWPGFGFYGIGVAELDEWAQATETKLLNALIDNVTLANTRMFSAPLGSNIDPGEPVYPGKIWMREPGEQIDTLQAGEVYPSLFQSIGQIQQISQQRTGISDIRQGDVDDLPSRTPAQTVQSALSQSNKRFDMILGNLRRDHGKVGEKILMTWSQYFQENPGRWRRWLQNTLGSPEASEVEDILRRGPEQLKRGFGIRLTATSSQSNKLAERQEFTALIQLINQVMPNLIQVAQMAEQAPPESVLSQTAAASYSGGVELLKRLLERFEVENPEEFLPDRDASAKMQAARQNAAQANGQQPQQPGQAQAQGVPPTTRASPLGGPQGAGPLAQGEDTLQQLLGLGG